MSNRTIVEINHDFGGAIRNDPEGFAALISEVVRCGVNGNPDNKTGAELERRLRGFGITCSPTHHHSDDVTLTLASQGRNYHVQRF